MTAMKTRRLQSAPGQVLEEGAALSWDRLAGAVLARYGWVPGLTDSLRGYATQVRIFEERYERRLTGTGPFGDVRYWQGRRYVRVRGAAAAVPGTSWHGSGLAVDVTGLNGFKGERYRQLASLAGEHGWTNTAGRTINEPWHWQYYPEQDRHRNTNNGGGGTAKPVPVEPPREEDGMYFLRVIDGARKDHVYQVGEFTVERLTSDQYTDIQTTVVPRMEDATTVAIDRLIDRTSKLRRYVFGPDKKGK